jgi:hypothetical protein
VVLTFHIGLELRLEYARGREVPVAPGPAELLPGSWRRWQQAFEAYDSGDEAETFQAWIELLANAAKNAVRMDAEIGLKAVEHLLGMFTAARLRLGRWTCGAKSVAHTNWLPGSVGTVGGSDPSYELPQMRRGRRRSGHGGWRHRARPAQISRRSSGRTASGKDRARWSVRELGRRERRCSDLAAMAPSSTVG